LDGFEQSAGQDDGEEFVKISFDEHTYKRKTKE